MQHIHVVARCVPLVCTQRCALCGFSNYVRGLPQEVHQIGNALQCGACKKEGRKEERKKGGEGGKEGSRFLISIHRACVGLVTELRSVPCSTCIPFKTYLLILTYLGQLRHGRAVVTIELDFDSDRDEAGRACQCHLDSIWTL